MTPILEYRSRPPDETARRTMCQPEDIAAAVVFACTLPARATVTEMVIGPTVSRDASAELIPRPGSPTMAGRDIGGCLKWPVPSPAPPGWRRLSRPGPISGRCARS